MAIRVTRKSPSSYQHGSLREALVNAGLKLLGEGGVANLSLRAAAQLAGVSHAAPYRHFKDKDALIAAIAEQGFRLLTAAMRAEEARAGGASVRARLMAHGRGYLKFATAHPGYLGVIFGGTLSKQHTTPELAAAGEEAYRVLRDAVAEGVTSGELRAGDPELLSLACWSMVHGLAHLVINHAVAPPGGPAALSAMVDGLLELLGTGVYARDREKSVRS